MISDLLTSIHRTASEYNPVCYGIDKSIKKIEKSLELNPILQNVHWNINVKMKVFTLQMRMDVK